MIIYYIYNLRLTKSLKMKRGVELQFIAKRFLVLIFVFVLLLSVFAHGVIAPSHPVITDEFGNVIGDDDGSVFISGVDTVIYVNKDISPVDAAIAKAIAEEKGYPIIYGDHDKVSPELLDSFKDDGIYRDVENVVIIGGPAVISSEVEKYIDSFGDVVGGFDSVRIAGTTGTGTAVEAIEYFYGPEMVAEVSLVSYEGDGDHSYDEILYLASQLDHPIIPIPSDVDGLPADVVESLDRLGVDSVDVIGSFENEAEVKTDLSGVNVIVSEEIKAEDSTDVVALEERLEDEVIESIQPGENVEVSFVELKEGEAPPVAEGNELVFFYEDKNDDGKDDDSGVAIDQMAVSLTTEIKNEGAIVEEVTCVGDEPDSVLQQVESSVEAQGIKTDIGDYDELREFDEDEAKEAAEEFKEADEKFEDLEETHAAEFKAALSGILEQFKAYYAEKKESGELSADSLELGAKIIDEANKEDAPALWELMHAFSNTERHEEYVEGCMADAGCVDEHIELEHVNVDDKLEKLIGTEKAREVANLDVGQKVGLLAIDDFVPPGKESEMRTRVSEVFAAGSQLSELSAKYVEKSKEEAYKTYTEQLKKEYEALGKTDEAAKLTIEEMKTRFDARLRIESEAYLTGVIKADEFVDPARRAEIISKFEGAAKELENKGIKDHHYMTHEDWKGVYETYSKEGKVTEGDVKKYDALVTAYKTYEKENPGTVEDPTGSYYDIKTGQFSFVNEEGKVVTGAVDSKSGKCSYTNEEGNFVEGNKEGNVIEYTKDNLPGGYKFDDKTGTYSDGKVTYIPPSHYNAFTGTYDFEHPQENKPEGYVIQCGSAGCSGGIYTGPGSSFDPATSGWTKSEDGKTWTAPGGDSYSTTQYSSSGSEHTDAYGHTWTQSSSGAWTSSTGEVHSGDAYHYSPPSDGGSTSTSGTYSGTTSGTYSGSTYTAPSGYHGTDSYSSSGGTSTGTTSGGSYSGGDSGGHSGGDSGGTGHAIFSGYSISEVEAGGKGLLSKWLRRLG